MVEGRMIRDDRVPPTLRELERVHGKDSGAGKAEPGRAYQGPVVGHAVEDDGKSYVVLDTGQELTAVPTDRRDLDRGHSVRARAEATAEQESRERRTLTLAFEDVEHERDHGRSR